MEIHVTADDVQSLLRGDEGADLTPVIVDGKQVALRLVGVRDGSTVARLGGANGDTIESLNGVPLTSIAGAYEAGFAAIRTSRVEVRGVRKSGEPYTTVLVID